MESITTTAISTASNNNFSVTLMAAIIGAAAALIGAFLGGYITHFSNKKGMQRKLQINACELIIEKLNKLSSIIFNVNSNIWSINYFMESYKEYLNASSDLISIYEKLIVDCVNTFDENYNLLDVSINELLISFESKEVILHDLNKIFNYFYNEIFACKMSCNLLRSHYSDLSFRVKKGALITDIVEHIDESLNDYKLFYSKSTRHLIDFKAELQNHYLSNLFENYKIAKRKPENQDDIVLSLDTYKKN